MIEYAMDINYMKKNISIQFISDVLTQNLWSHIGQQRACFLNVYTHLCISHFWMYGIE